MKILNKIFLILNLIYLINCLEISNYKQNENILIINGTGFKHGTFVMLGYSDYLIIPQILNENELQINLPILLENCEFYVFNSQSKSNSLNLILNPIIKSINTKIDQENENFIFTIYGDYIWSSKDLNQYQINLIENENNFIQCNDIKNLSISLDNQIMECSLNKNLILNLNSIFKINFRIGENVNILYEFSIELPIIETIEQIDSSIFISGINFESGILSLDELSIPIKVYFKEFEISKYCKNSSKENIIIECFIGPIIIQHQELNQINSIMDIKIYSRGFYSNYFQIKIEPFIFTNENILIYPISNQNITLNYYLPNNNSKDLKLSLIMNDNVIQEYQNDDLKILNLNQLSFILLNQFISNKLNLKISNSIIETNKVQILQLLEPSIEYFELLDNDTIKIIGENLNQDATLSFSNKPLQCFKNETSLLCKFKEFNQINSFSNCGLIIYNDNYFSSSKQYYPKPIIYSGNFDGTYLIINSTINCESIDGNYFESEIFVDVFGLRTPLSNFSQGLFIFFYPYHLVPNLDFFDILFSVKGVNSTFKYSRLSDFKPIVSQVKFLNNKIIIDGSGLTTNAVVTYSDKILECISTLKIIENSIYSNRLECVLPSSIDINSINQCGIIDYSDNILKQSILFFIEPKIYNGQIIRKKDLYKNEIFNLDYININGTINCDNIPINQYKDLNLMIILDEKNSIPYNFNKDENIFRFNFQFKQLPIPNKSEIELYLSIGYNGLKSNKIIIKSDQDIIDENDNLNFLPNNSNLKFNNFNFDIILILIIILIVI